MIIKNGIIFTLFIEKNFLKEFNKMIMFSENSKNLKIIQISDFEEF